jgi:hypothetical protein
MDAGHRGYQNRRRAAVVLTAGGARSGSALRNVRDQRIVLKGTTTERAVPCRAPLAAEAGSAMTIGHDQALDELTGPGMPRSRAARSWPHAVAAAAAVTAVVAGLVLVPALTASRSTPSPTLPLPAVGLPPGVVPWLAAVAPQAKVAPHDRPAAGSSRLSALSATLSFPVNVTLGTPVSYAVTLANRTRHAVSLSPCPSFSQTLAGADGWVGYYYLNCGAAPSVPPGGSVTFEMAAPAPVQLGTISLVWRLQRTAVTAQATATVLVGTPAGAVN